MGESQLQAFVEGALPPPAHSAVEAHLASCDACRELLAETARATLPESSDASIDSGVPGTPEASQRTPEVAGLREPPGPLRSIGRYQFVRAIGAGGMGVVYEARDPQLDRRVALKILRGPATAGARALLLGEARALAKLSHPNVIAVHDVAEVDGQICLAMELVEGPTLLRWLAEAPRGWRAIAAMFAQAARALEAAHAAGLVHRDFKLDNALIDASGRLRVTDFGLALPAAAPGDASGSAAYMAPEQRRGAPADARADVYSFAVALDQALQGEAIPAGLRRAIDRAREADPARRTASLRALRESLEAALGAGRRRFARAAASLAAVALLSLLGVALWQRAALSRLEDDKRALDARIAGTLAKMEASSKPDELRALDASLQADEALAEHATRALAARGAPADKPDPFRRDLQALLAKLGARTYLVPPLFADRVRAHAQRILASRSLAAARARMPAFMAIARPALAARGLPAELAFLSFVESAFDADARSPAGAVGAWQLMPSTARRYGLTVDGARDDRRDLALASRAAAAYLADLLADFGSDAALLAIASYNFGESGVRSVLHQLAQEPGGLGPEGRDFWFLYRRKLLSAETREYVPAVLAAALVLGESDAR